MRFVRASESADRCKSVPPREGASERRPGGRRRGVGGAEERAGERKEDKGGEGRIDGRRKKRLSPFFLFGVAIERAGDQVVDTCSASPTPPRCSLLLSPPPPRSLLPSFRRHDSRFYGISCRIVGICLSRFVRVSGGGGDRLPLSKVASQILNGTGRYVRAYLLISGANRSRGATIGWRIYRRN